MSLASVAHAETMRNEDVVALLEAGLGEEAVIAKIETSEGDFDTEYQYPARFARQGCP